MAAQGAVSMRSKPPDRADCRGGWPLRVRDPGAATVVAVAACCAQSAPRPVSIPSTSVLRRLLTDPRHQPRAPNPPGGRRFDRPASRHLPATDGNVDARDAYTRTAVRCALLRCRCMRQDRYRWNDLAAARWAWRRGVSAAGLNPGPAIGAAAAAPGEPSPG